jgi:hypothetical protein
MQSSRCNALGATPSQESVQLAWSAHPARTFGLRRGSGSGAMLVACRLAGLSTLEAQYAGLTALTQS